MPGALGYRPRHACLLHYKKGDFVKKISVVWLTNVKRIFTGTFGVSDFRTMHDALGRLVGSTLHMDFS